MATVVKLAERSLWRVNLNEERESKRSSKVPWIKALELGDRRYLKARIVWIL